MSTESMLDKLGRYYHEQGISAKDFNCRHIAACKAVCKPYEMVSLPESYVGPEYEGGTLPRLLFVSSDTNNAKWLKSISAGWGSLMDIREDRLLYHRQSGPNTHWGQTLNLAGALLAHFAIERLSNNIDHAKIVEYIAHANSTRCKDSTIGSKEGSPMMPSNCRELLLGEVMVMQPDIIVTQGKRAGNALAGAFPVIRRVSMPGCPNTFYQIVQLGANHTAIMIVAKHPCARGRNGWKRGEKKEFVNWVAKSVLEFIPVA